jgi:hypothetical protein
MGGLADMIVPWSQVTAAYGGVAKPRALVGITGGGHLAFSDLCQITNAAGQNLLQVVNATTSAVLERTLQCRGPATLDQIAMMYPQTGGISTIRRRQLDELTGHVTMMAAWWWYFASGYHGVGETLAGL